VKGVVAGDVEASVPEFVLVEFEGFVLGKGGYVVLGADTDNEVSGRFDVSAATAKKWKSA
jgi:hypothetical protein